MRPAFIGGGIVTVVIALIIMILGGDPSAVLETAPQTDPTQMPAPAGAPEDSMGQFVATVLADTEDTWNPLLAEAGTEYREPVLVLFDDVVQSACGTAQAAVGPFYCPVDERLYIDLNFYRDLKERLGAPGDFAQAYVIAHEVGHHVQTQMGVTQQVAEMRGRLSPEENNALSVRVELQADCYAGVWAHHADRARRVIEAGDIEEALNAASAIGDDRLQRQAQGYVVPESFTHGTSEQRVRWFRRGLQNGDINSCDTFNVSRV
jgi:predicted metalloprotease